MNPFRSWLEQHLDEATAEFKKLQAYEDQTGDNRELYEQVHQMWGYLAGLEKCLKEFDSHIQSEPAAKASKKAPKKAPKSARK